MCNSDLVLQSDQLVCGYVIKKQNKVIIKANNLTLHKGELTILVGQNGSGKTTLLHTLQGLLPLLQGNIYLQQQKIQSFSKKELAKKIAFVSTEINSLAITVTQLVALGRYPYSNLFGTLQPKDHDIIQNCLISLQLQEQADSFLYALSDGQKQKAMIARALAQEPSLLFLDEPTAFLDWVTKTLLLDKLKALAKQRNIAVLLSLHDIPLAVQYADKMILVVSDEQEIWQGQVEEVLEKKKLQDIFPTMTMQDEKYIKQHYYITRQVN